MERATQLALNALNQRFYARVASDWIESRKTPWPGFARVLAHVAARHRETRHSPLRVLDAGCGDGRFAAYLNSAWPHPVEYLGLDASPELLRYAQQRQLGPQFRFEACDFVKQPPSAALPMERFELITLFAVLHHVPGSSGRLALVRQLAARLQPAGTLALTFWRLPDDPRFASRVLPWSSLDAAERAHIPEAELEPGDTLLRFGNVAAPPRYCHFPSEAETAELLAQSGLAIAARFRADGRGDQLNEYVLLES